MKQNCKNLPESKKCGKCLYCQEHQKYVSNRDVILARNKLRAKEITEAREYLNSCDPVILLNRVGYYDE